MKKPGVFCISALLYLNVTAQVTSINNKQDPVFCKTIKEIESEANSVTGFSYVCDPKANESFWDKNCKTRLILPGFTDCYIIVANSKYSNAPANYYAEMKSFDSESMAMARIEDVKNKLTTCLTNYDIEKNPTHYDLGQFQNIFSDIVVNYRFFQKINNNISSRFFLRLEKLTAKDSAPVYTISLFVSGISKEDATKISQQDNRKQEQTGIKKQLQQLLGYTTDGFKAIRGEKTKSEQKKQLMFGMGKDRIELINSYNSKTKVIGSKKCIITETFPREEDSSYSYSEFHAVMTEGSSKEEGESIYNKLLKQLKEEFSGDFEIKEYSEDMKYGNYFKTLTIAPLSDKMHTIELMLMFMAGSAYIPDDATIEITIK